MLLNDPRFGLMEDSRFIQLVTQKLSNELTFEEEQELKALIEFDESYAQRYRSLMEYWANKEADHANSSRLFQRLSARISEAEQTNGQQTEEVANRQPRRLWSSYWFKSAAVILCVLTGALVYYASKQQENESQQLPQQIATSLSAIKVITLEDGSTVKLNGNSTLSGIKMFSDHREITLNGEGFFDIAKDPDRPFTIHTSKMDIRVLGTAFNVRAYPNEKSQETVLIHGAIRVTLHNKERSVILMKPNDKLTIDLTKPAGVQAAPAVKSYAISKLEHYENESEPAVVETAWTNDHLVFRDETFEVLAHRLEVRYGVKIILSDARLKDLRFNGTFKKESLQDVLYVLSRTGNPFTYEIDGREVHIH